MRADASAVINLLLQAHALDISMFAADFIERTLEKRKNALRCATYKDYMLYLGGSRIEAEGLNRDMLISYSEFFRTPLNFTMLERVVLPAVAEQKLASGQALRVWSAGCAAGQEAYSIAMLLQELSAMLGNALNYQITATDINPASLSASRAGIYEQNALDNVCFRRIRTFFENQKAYYSIKDILRQSVDFSEFDLLNEKCAFPPAAVFGGFDLVMCCNLLYYYNAQAQKTILAKLRRALVPGGFLMTDESERDIIGALGGFIPLSAYHSIFNKIG